jgi:hypothetical protein
MMHHGRQPGLNRFDYFHRHYLLDRFLFTSFCLLPFRSLNLPLVNRFFKSPKIPLSRKHNDYNNQCYNKDS